MSNRVEIVQPPTVRTLATSLVGRGQESFFDNETSLRATVIAETLRIGLFQLSLREGVPTPVHPLSLRSWVRHKLEPVIPQLLEEGENNFREALCEGRGANLEFLGDALVLTNGYLYPAPTRVVQVAPDNHILLSGLPSNQLGSLTESLVYSALGRRLVGVGTEKYRSLGIPMQSLDEYLGSPNGVPKADTFLGSLLARSREAWRPGKGWEVYTGNSGGGPGKLEGTYGFAWEKPNELRGRRFCEVDFHSAVVSLWREPLTERYFHYWLAGRSASASFGIPILNGEWKQACLSLDMLAGRPREATLVRNLRGPGVLLSLSFQPFEALYRALHVFNARFKGWQRGSIQWEIPAEAREHIRQMLERAGVRTRVIGV